MYLSKLKNTLLLKDGEYHLSLLEKMAPIDLLNIGFP